MVSTASVDWKLADGGAWIGQLVPGVGTLVVKIGPAATVMPPPPPLTGGGGGTAAEFSWSSREKYVLAPGARPPVKVIVPVSFFLTLVLMFEKVVMGPA